MVDEKVYRYDQVTKPDISNKQFEKYQKEFMAAESELMMTCQLLNSVVAKQISSLSSLGNYQWS